MRYSRRLRELDNRIVSRYLLTVRIGKDFMLEAIDAIKGVLGFEELPGLSRSSTNSSSPNASPSLPSSPAHIAMHTRAVSQPQPLSKPPVPARQSKRPRAPSDPFLDAPTPALSRSPASSTSVGSGMQADDPPTPRDDDDAFDDRTPTRVNATTRRLSGVPLSVTPLSARAWAAPQPECEDSLRLWVAPDLSDPELLSLLDLFPSFISRHALPRFPPGAENSGDAEMGEPEETLRAGTGRMWVGARERSDGWRGGWWTRFKAWWHRVFC